MKLPIRTLAGRRGLEFSAICLRSLVRNSAEPLRLIVHSDGSLGAREMDYLREHVDPDASFVSEEEASDAVEPALARLPHLKQFRKAEVLARKIIDISLLETGDRIRYCDTDIAFFERFSGLFSRVGANEAMFMKDTQSAYAFAWNLDARRLFPLPDSLNSGLIDFPKARFDLGHLEEALAEGAFLGWRSWREQTLWASLATRTRNVWPDGVVIPAPGQALAGDRAWHLVSTIRDKWDAAALAAACAAPDSAAAPYFAMRAFTDISYPGYISQRSRNSLGRRLRAALARSAPDVAAAH